MCFFARGSLEGRFLVWPNLRHRADLRKHRSLYLSVIDDVYFEGRWTLVVDESLWATNPRGLDLGDPLSELAFGGRSNLISLVVLSQRSLVPNQPLIWTNVSQALTFKQGRTDDIRELATLGTYPPRDVSDAIASLEEYQFLDLPVRAQADWAVSRVPESWA